MIEKHKVFILQVSKKTKFGQNAVMLKIAGEVSGFISHTYAALKNLFNKNTQLSLGSGKRNMQVRAPEP